ncbi:MAG TPA: iron-containing alcohol dehydrogenase [Ramlibacter sp.]|nr:iron-containing alcohol dehydrogenase [Ramlibacter sp.]
MMLPKHFSHRNPPSKLVFGEGAIARLADELQELGVRRPVLVAGRRTAASQVYAQTRQALAALAMAELTGMPEHSPIVDVARLRDLARSHRADGFIAIGGGSASDACKAAALWLAEGGELARHATRFIPPDQLHSPPLPADKLPVVAIPTTLSAAEVTAGGSVRTEDGRKLILVDPKVAARLIVIDPIASLEVPAPIFLASGMNGLAHCIEGYYSRVRTPITSALALEAMRMFLEALPAVARDPGSAEARSMALVAAHLSGQVLLNARSCIHHATCHCLGAVAGISHGDANNIVLPHAMAFNRRDPQAERDLAECAQALGATSSTADAAIERVRWLQQAIGVPTRLRDRGMVREQLPLVAERVMAEKGLYVNPRRVSGPQEVMELLEAAW